MDRQILKYQLDIVVKVTWQKHFFLSTNNQSQIEERTAFVYRYLLNQVQKYFPAQQIFVFHYVNCNNVCVKYVVESDLGHFYGCILQYYLRVECANESDKDS